MGYVEGADRSDPLQWRIIYIMEVFEYLPVFLPEKQSGQWRPKTSK